MICIMTRPRHLEAKRELARWLPTESLPDVGGKRSALKK
jgi:hypothetical protein